MITLTDNMARGRFNMLERGNSESQGENCDARARIRVNCCVHTPTAGSIEFVFLSLSDIVLKMCFRIEHLEIPTKIFTVIWAVISWSASSRKATRTRVSREVIKSNKSDLKSRRTGGRDGKEYRGEARVFARSVPRPAVSEKGPSKLLTLQIGLDFVFEESFCEE